MSLRKNRKKLMYGKYQVPCGKVELRETGKQAACRELYEETGLSISHKRFRYLKNDPDFDCDVFLVRLNWNERLRLTEPQNMFKW